MNVSLQADSGIRTRLFNDSSQPLMTTLPLLWPSPASRSLNQQIIFHWMWVLLLNKSVRPLSVLIFSLVNQPNFLALIWNDLSRSPPPLSLSSLCGIRYSMPQQARFHLTSFKNESKLNIFSLKNWISAKTDQVRETAGSAERKNFGLWWSAWRWSLKTYLMFVCCLATVVAVVVVSFEANDDGWSRVGWFLSVQILSNQKQKLKMFFFSGVAFISFIANCTRLKFHSLPMYLLIVAFIMIVKFHSYWRVFYWIQQIINGAVSVLNCQLHSQWVVCLFNWIHFFAVLLSPVLDGFEWVLISHHTVLAVIKSRRH